MRLMRILVVVLALASVVPQALTPPAPPSGSGADTTNAPAWAGMTGPDALTAAADAHLAHAQGILDRLLAVGGPRTIANTFRPYDDIFIELGLAEGPANLIARMPPDKAFGDAAQRAVQKVASFQAALSLNRKVYDALLSVDTSGADGEARHYLARELAAFKRAGVDKDDAARARLQELRQELVRTTQQFAKNVAEGTRSLTTRAASLDGLPVDFIARHPADGSGLVTLTTGDVDARPVLTYARDDGLRKRMYVALNTIAPENAAVLERMLALRAEIARLAGFPSWAEYDIAPRMAGSAAAAGAFIDRMVSASEGKARRELDALVQRKRQDVPGADGLTAWESIYYAELVRRALYDFDSQRLRPFLPFGRVKEGLLDITSGLFGVTYRRVHDVRVWHPSVEAFELLEDGRLMGRFYLDLHPRAEKRSNGAATTPIRKGVIGRQIPEVALVASFPGGQAGDPGLMTHDEVKVFFHEFGHVMQNLLASRRSWIGTAGAPVERDFNEVHAQMFEEWTMDAGTLATFARHYQTNQPVPADLVGQLRRASGFGQGLYVRSQMVMARLSLALHERDPATINPRSIGHEIQARYVPYEAVEDIHLETRFTQLANGNYTASYYTYMWSLVIAKDLFSKFEPANLLATGPARRYRETVLIAGASKPAAAIVEDFLGRPFEFTAWETWLNAGP
jgi:thimet oligopeptidase